MSCSTACGLPLANTWGTVRPSRAAILRVTWTTAPVLEVTSMRSCRAKYGPPYVRRALDFVFVSHKLCRFMYVCPRPGLYFTRYFTKKIKALCWRLPSVALSGTVQQAM
jgi:hypothetical protein